MPWNFVLIEASVFLLFAAVAWTAARRGGFDVSLLVSGGCFGLAIELYFVHGAAGYEYGHFLVMVAGAPLWVALGWACILYTTMRTANDLPLRPWGRPLAAALMAVSLDLALDPVAEGLGWWHWKRASDFFGVSYDNFNGWLMIVGFYSAAVFSLRDWRGSRSWIPPLSILAGLVAVVGGQWVLEHLYRWAGSEGVVFFVACSAVTVALVVAREEGPMPWFRIAVPGYFHLLFAVLLLSTPLAGMHPELYGVFALASAVSLLLFLDGPARPSDPAPRSDA